MLLAPTSSAVGTSPPTSYNDANPNGMSKAGQAALRTLSRLMPKNKSFRFAVFEKLGSFSNPWQSKWLQSHRLMLKKPSEPWQLQSPPHAAENIKFKWDGHGELELKIQAEITSKTRISNSTGAERWKQFTTPLVMKIFYESGEARPNVFEQLQAFQLYVPPRRPRVVLRPSFYYRVIGIVRLGAPGEPDIFRVSSLHAHEESLAFSAHETSLSPGT